MKMRSFSLLNSLETLLPDLNADRLLQLLCLFLIFKTNRPRGGRVAMFSLQHEATKTPRSAPRLKKHEHEMVSAFF